MGLNKSDVVSFSILEFVRKKLDFVKADGMRVALRESIAPEVSPPCMTGDVLCAGGSRTGAADDGRRECQREHSGAAVGR